MTGVGTEGGGCATGDRVERILSEQQERVVRMLRTDGSIPADPLLRNGVSLESEEYVTVCYEFHHVLLPELADAGLVEFDRVEDEVRRGPNFERAHGFLAQIDDDREE